MRAELFYKPELLLTRFAEIFSQRARLRQLRGTCAGKLGIYHIDSLELIQMVGRSGAKVIYDIGASVGTWTQLCKAVIPQGQIYAFEPLAEQCEAFRKNTSNLGNVFLFEQALGEKNGNSFIHRTDNVDASSLLPVSAQACAEWSLQVEEIRAISLACLDEVIKEKKIPAPNFIKLDVQGYEMKVLKGGREAVRSAKWILAEASFKRFYEGQVLFSELAGFLSEQGFEVFAFGFNVKKCQKMEQVDVLFGRVEDPSK